ncbi:MAG: COX15/CtaA family protein [candidate division Zixibacteria bacterium]|nr:COX15/CtaA family protein [candidate division Zixibacteria bacterium]MBU1470322.1 COX15/CtaA family protein [candidate division Zixibacteria bacterium]MBU2624769.1 COX15/CtaA family protein [candidate division Zixibacteria bacterium]
MKGFLRLSFITTAATYLLIFIGSLVRVSGAGLGCPDWPKCFGKWIPPVSAMELPHDIDPSLFNFTLAWIEYFNRLCGVAVGFLILATAIMAVIHYRKVPKIVYPSIIAALLVAFQGWQGGEVVASDLQPIIVSVHMGLAFIIVSLMIYVTQQAFYVENPDASKGASYPAKSHIWIGIVWLVTITQIIVGTQVRSAIEVIEENFPLLNAAEILQRVEGITLMHTAVGLLTMALVWLVGSRILRGSKNPSPIISKTIRGMMILSIVQIMIGLSLMLVGVPALMQVFHLWAASLLVGMLLLAYSELKRA